MTEDGAIPGCEYLESLVKAIEYDEKDSNRSNQKKCDVKVES